MLSVFVNGRIGRSIFRSVSTSELWAGKFGEVSSLGALITALDGPGNEVFEDGDIDGARARMQLAADSLAARLTRLEATLPAGLPPRDSALIITDLERVLASIPLIRDEAESVFVKLRRQEIRPATRHMAAMDAAYNASLRAIRTLRADVGAAQDALLRNERSNAEAASRLLRLAAVAMLLLAIGGGWLGYRLAREAEQQATEREATMQLVARAQADLEEAHGRLTAAHQELESFSYSVAHDLRSPLRSIHGFSAALEQDNGEALNADGRSHLERIKAASLRMERLIDDLLRLSRVSRQSLVQVPLDLTAMANEVVKDLRLQDPGRTVDVEIASGLLADGDPALLRVVLQNLIGNAWKFTRHTPQARIRVARESDDKWVGDVFVVQDNGAGFDMTYAKKLFGAFQRMHTTSEFEGTGIGLATVQRIVHRHQGRIWAEAAVGQGATFRFTMRRGTPT